MPNSFYNHSNGIPITQSRGASSAIRSELDGVAAGFDGVKAAQDTQATALAALNTALATLPGGFAATSTTSLTVATGSKSLTVQPGKAYSAGQAIVVADTSAPATNWMFGQIVSYDSSTGALVVLVNTINGGGTISAWTVSLSSNPAASTQAVLAQLQATALSF